MNGVYGYPFSLEGEIAFITGGGTGIGFGIARSFIDAGARVVIAGRREDVLQSACKELGENCSWERFDVAHIASAPEVVERVRSRLGDVSLLVNNAGVHLKKAAQAQTEEEITSTLQVHLVGAHALAAAVYPGMKRAEKGGITFIASMAALIGLPYVASYAAAKSAVLGLVRTLAVEWGRHNIRVNAVAPGWIDSEMMRMAMQDDRDRESRILSRTPLGRFGEADDIGHAVRYLSSPAAQFITGTVLTVDGGASIGF